MAGVQHKRSSVDGKVPLPGDLAVGEIAINFTNKKLFTKDGGNNVIDLFSGLGGGASGAQVAYQELTGTTPSLDLSQYGMFYVDLINAPTTLSFTNPGSASKFTIVAKGSLAGSPQPYNLTVAGAIEMVSNGDLDLATEIYDVEMKADGTKALGMEHGNLIRQWTLSTPGDLTTATNDGTLDISGQVTFPKGIGVNDDGTEFIVVDDSIFYYYTMTTAWDITTASYSGSSHDFSAQTTTAAGATMKPDGFKLYIIDSNNVYEYAISKLKTISNLSYDTNTYSNGKDNRGIAFNSDGTKAVVYDKTKRRFYGYDLSTAWDLSTASNTGNAYIGDTDLYGLVFKPDGTKCYMIKQSTDSIREYTLSTPWDVTTISQTHNTADIGTSPEGIGIKSDGTRIYYCDGTSIKQYDLSTPWDLSTLSGQIGTSGTLQYGDTRSVFFNDTGTKMYSIGTDDIIYQYSLSTAWDISTLSYDTISFSVTTQTTTAACAHYDGGNRVIVADYSGNWYRYTLPSTMDVTYSGSDTISGSNNTIDIKFNPDGTEFFILGEDTLGTEHWVVRRHTMSTAWDATNNSTGGGQWEYETSLSPGWLCFNHNGEKFSIGYSSDNFKEFLIQELGYLQLPATVQANVSFGSPNLNERRIYEFITYDGGTSYQLTNYLTGY